MRIKQTTLTVTEPEKKQSYWRQKTKSAQWSQICAGVICVVGFLLIFSFTLSIAIESGSTYNIPHVTRISHRTFPDKQPKCEIKLVTKRLIVCKKLDINDNVSAEVEKLYEEFPNETGEDYVNLEIEDISIRGGVLAENWINSSFYYIETLKLSSDNIKNVENRAFIGSIFNEIKILTIEKITLNSLGKDFFEGLRSLKQLNFRKCNIKEIQSNALEYLQNNLETLQVQEMKYPWDPLNLTGTTQMYKLSTIDFSYNNGFTTIFNDKTFSGSKKCVQLYLMESHITEIGEEAFVPLINLMTIHLENNALTDLNENVFNYDKLNIIQIDENNWNCSCNLEWLKKLHENGIVIGNPVCQPKSIPFNKTIFCEDNPSTSDPVSNITETTTVPDETTSSDPTTTISESTTDESIIGESTSKSTSSAPETTITETPGLNTTDATTETNPNKIHLNCTKYEPNKSSRRKLLSDSRYIANLTIDFEINDSDPGTIQINIISNLDDKVTLLWFPIDSKNLAASPDCMTFECQKERNKISIPNLITGKSYTFCFVNSNEEKIPPLNCKSHIVRKLLRDEPWILNGSKGLVIGMTALGFLLFCLISALLMYVIVRKYPSLMRGSKRVVMVKGKNVEAIVLPPNFNEVQPKAPQIRLPEPEFRRNVFRRSVSETSIVSGSYISPVEPTVTQLLNFRLERLRNKCGYDNVISETSGTFPKLSPTAPAVPPRPLSPMENWDCASFSEISTV